MLPPQAPEPVATFDPRDHVAPVLASDSSLNDDQRFDLHELFHSVPSTTELAHHLSGLNLPHSLKEQMLIAKNNSLEANAPPPPEPTGPQAIDKVIAHLIQMDPKEREIAESHPKLLAAFISAHGAENEHTKT